MIPVSVDEARAVVASERFRSRVVKSGACFVWTGQISAGYGRIMFNGRRAGAHRLAYIAAVGPIPDGMQLDHLCRNRACVNPEHLEPVTNSENLRRGLNGALKTHCPKGHPWTEENIYVQKNNGRRSCKVCKKANNARRSKKN